MKLKGLTKLALSGVALAAVAATLGTSTYAWYVSNNTATVSGAQGSTAGAETTGSLYAASESMHASGQWSNKIALASGTDYTAATQLVPVTKVTSTATSAFSATQASTWSAPTGEFADKAGADVSKAQGAYLEFNFYLIARGDASKGAIGVTPSLTITNTTEDKTTTQKAYTGAHLPGTSLATNSTFKVDAVHALRIQIDQTAAATTSSATTATALTSIHSADSDFETYNTASGFDAPGTGDANAYYASLVNGINLYGCTSATENNVTSLFGSTALEQNKWTKFWLIPEQETEITFKVWLEGTDKDCFDSCIGQSFKFDFSFTI